MGSGSTAVGAKKLGRHYIGFDVSKEYCKIAERRLQDTEVESPLFSKPNTVSTDRLHGLPLIEEYQISIEPISSRASAVKEHPISFKEENRAPLK